MNQFDDQDQEFEFSREEPTEENQTLPVWRYRLLSIILLLAFLVPILLSVLQIALRWLTPQVQPTPPLPENLLHG